MEQLKNYFWDKTGEAFGEVDLDRGNYSFTGLSEARGWDVCGALLECLDSKIKEFEMERKGAEK